MNVVAWVHCTLKYMRGTTQHSNATTGEMRARVSKIWKAGWKRYLEISLQTLHQPDRRGLLRCFYILFRIWYIYCTKKQKIETKTKTKYNTPVGSLWLLLLAYCLALLANAHVRACKLIIRMQTNMVIIIPCFYRSCGKNVAEGTACIV